MMRINLDEYCGQTRGIQEHVWAIRTWLVVASTALAIATTACSNSDGDTQNDGDGTVATRSVVVYCSVDEAFAKQVMDRFRKESGIDVVVTFDSEAGKTTGLVNKIIAESRAGRARADVFWSSEIFNTIRLARMGILKPYASRLADDIPPRYRDNQHRWTALAARARVVAFDPKQTPLADVPTLWRMLSKPETAAVTTIANPLFGTTRGHVAAMFALWGEGSGRTFLIGLRDSGSLISSGNSSAVRAVIAGRAKFAMTDSDDVWVAQRSGASLDLVYPDMGDGGTLMIPCTVAMVAGRPDSEAARRLVDFLVSEKVERMLARSDSRNVPVRATLRAELGMDWPPETKVSFDAVVDAMDGAVTAVREILLR